MCREWKSRPGNNLKKNINAKFEGRGYQGRPSNKWEVVWKEMNQIDRDQELKTSR